jgi:hypothetical protein
VTDTLNSLVCTQGPYRRLTVYREYRFKKAVHDYRLLLKLK